MTKHNIVTESKSKSQLKREMLALQALGEQLVKLTSLQLDKLPLNEPLRTAIRAAQTITSRSAHRRQLQYIGRLMRECDPTPIQQALVIIQHKDQQTTAQHHRLEKWRDQLIAEGDAALVQILNAFPNADHQHLRQLIRKARQEQQTGQTPQATRHLFRYLRNLEE